ncbi:hypothetical protein F4778DRAFT_765711 [Xylariomycetidae sp. FL2044]|nr:hypothetical protein F4778DRAFT_765711 [Xylariomycetidae sp. FL2044]
MSSEARGDYRPAKQQERPSINEVPSWYDFERSQEKALEDLLQTPTRLKFRSGTEDQDDLTLPPKHLKEFTGFQAWRDCVSVFVVTGILVGITFGCMAVKRQGGTSANNCDSDLASGSERNFLIDRRMAENLSFTQAKLIDVVWDTVVGQGGKFLHGACLYYAAARALTWLMEISAVPYHFSLNLLFKTASFSSLWSASRILARRNPVRMTIAALWLAYCIIYVLSFSTIWSAATGYLSPSVPAYAILDKAFVTQNSTDLRVCWSIQDSRLGVDAKTVIKGPPFYAVFQGGFSDMTTFKSYASGDGITNNLSKDYWGVIRDLYMFNSTLWPEDANSFMDVYSYSISKRTLQAFYGTNSGESLVGAVSNASGNYSRCASGSDTRYGTTFNCTEDSQLFESVAGWMFNNAGDDSPFATVAQTRSPTTFVLDPSVAPGPDVVPYNSTLRLNGEVVALDAPFLQLGTSCSSWAATDAIGSCLCLGDDPIPTDFRRRENLSCISEVDYVWGFASTITFAGLVAEAVWIVGIVYLWYGASGGSGLVGANRAGVGTVRNLLDLAEAINRDLGDKTCAYSERELNKRLGRCDDLGWFIEKKVGDGEGEEGVDHIGMRGVPKGLKRRSREMLKVDLDREFG